LKACKSSIFVHSKTTSPLAFRRIIACALLCAAISASACAKKSATASRAAEPQALPVTVAVAHRGTIAERLTLTGTTAAKQQANLSSAITGAVLAVNANVGDRVRAGQVLIRIDDSTLRAQLEQNEASLAAAQARLAQTQSGNMGASATANANLESARVAYQTAQTNLRRNQQLLAQGYVSQSAVDQSQQAAAAAQAQLRSAEVAAQQAAMTGNAQTSAQSEIRSLQAAVAQSSGAVRFISAQIAQTVIAAPFDGVVTQRSVDTGTLAGPGTALLQVSQLNPIYVNIGVPEESLPYIHAGTQVNITVDSQPGRVWHGAVATVNGATTQGTLSYLARVVLPNNDLQLRAGMVANGAFVKAERRNVVIVPRAAIFTGDTGDAVYVLAKASPGCKCSGKAKSVAVQRGLQTDNDAQVSGPGISPGTSIILQRPDQLRDGSPVSVGSTGGQAPSSSRT